MCGVALMKAVAEWDEVRMWGRESGGVRMERV